jgi:hypothetical protein
VLDATYNWWGDASGPTHASNPDGTGDAVSDNVDYANWLKTPMGEAVEVWADDSWNSQEDVNEYNPELIWHYDAFNNIQDAIDAAADGSIVHVLAGIYDGFVVEGRSDISIAGEEEGVVVTGANMFVDGGEWWVMAVVMNSTNIDIRGIDFHGEEIEVGMLEGIAYGESTGSIADVTISNITGTYMAMGLCIWGETEGATAVDASSLTVENCTMGIVVTNAEANLDNCVVTGMAPYGGTGIMAMDGTMIDMDNCEIYDCWLEEPSPGQAGFGMMIAMPEDYEAMYGIVDERACMVDMTGCTISNNNFGIYVSDDGNLVANFNNIAGNDIMGVYNGSAEMADATYNWWGDASGPTHASNPDGTGDAVSDNVNYWLWLPSPIDEPQGAQGPQGEQGDIGPQGETGPQGVQGEQGPAGGITLSIAAIAVAAVALIVAIYAAVRKKA